MTNQSPLILSDFSKNPSPFQSRMDAAYLEDDELSLKRFQEILSFLSPGSRRVILKNAHTWAEHIRENTSKSSFNVETLLHAYPLSSKEGLILMNLAEALLRIPDKETAQQLIKDKLSLINWENLSSKNTPFPLKLSNWILNLTQKSLNFLEDSNPSIFPKFFKELFKNQVDPLIQKSFEAFVGILAKQFICAEDLKEALPKLSQDPFKRYYFSYDVLGEAALTDIDAHHYFEGYKTAIHTLKGYKEGSSPRNRPGISVKLSALHPRYDYSQKDRVLKELGPKLLSLTLLAKDANIGLTIDAEEVDKLELSLELLRFVLKNSNLQGWDGMGFAIQAYQKRALGVIDYLEDLAKSHKIQLMTRLVKGAYWDSEIKRAQMQGLSNYPVFTRKGMTDLSYLCSAHRILSAGSCFYPQFATHNAYTISAILEMRTALNYEEPFEFQKLFGMMNPLYDQILEETQIPCRIYAPIGKYRELLPYLVRRIIENGANSSFIHQLEDLTIPLDTVVQDILTQADSWKSARNPQIPLPSDLYSPRKNSKNFDLTYSPHLSYLKHEMQLAENALPKKSSALIAGEEIFDIGPKALMHALEYAAHDKNWSQTPVHMRAHILEKAADLLENRMPYFMTLLVREAKKTLKDAASEVREAVDYCRYYAQEARRLQSFPIQLPSITGESNTLSLETRGVFVCISPWNFPLAISLGQITAALVTGNTVLAKPSHQTSLIGYCTIKLLFEAGVPHNALHFLPVSGHLLEEYVLKDSRLNGVAFTGSYETAQHISQVLSISKAPIIPFIAETGGVNAMIVDSSALFEHAIQDILISAFQSAGQRCSSLRLLCIQDEIFDPFLTMLIRATSELTLCDPGLLKTDIGPLINSEQKQILETYIKKAKRKFSPLFIGKSSSSFSHTSYLPPHIFEISKISDVPQEIFGPILHVMRFKKENLPDLIKDINALGFGLTLGIQSRVNSTIAFIEKHASVGNTYVNRSQIGAIVESQPFGGEGLSGTGPKAGGPFYLSRFCVERTRTTNTSAWGGNQTLLTLNEDLTV